MAHLGVTPNKNGRVSTTPKYRTPIFFYLLRTPNSLRPIHRELENGSTECFEDKGRLLLNCEGIKLVVELVNITSIFSNRENATLQCRRFRNIATISDITNVPLIILNYLIYK